MPRPRVDVFLDNENKGTLQEGQNVVTIDGVTAGSHKLVVLAKNLSGEVIDRKEINCHGGAARRRGPVVRRDVPRAGVGRLLRPRLRACERRARASGAERPSSERSPTGSCADDLDARGDDDGSDGDTAGNGELRSSPTRPPDSGSWFTGLALRRRA